MTTFWKSYITVLCRLHGHPRKINVALALIAIVYCSDFRVFEGSCAVQTFMRLDLASI